MARLQDALKSLHQRQQQVLAETDRLEQLRAAKGERSRAEASSVHAVTREQKALEAEARAQAQKLSAAQVFELALSAAADDMVRATGQLERGETGAAAQRAEQDAASRLAALVEVLKPASQNKGNSKAGGQGGGDKQAGSSDAIRMLSELKLLKWLQEDLNRRFRDLPELADPEERAALQAQLSREQGRLADVAFRLSKPIEGNPEDDPDQLPDLRRTDGDDAGSTGRPRSLEDALLPADGEP